jgi:hypothetical protein
MVTTSVATDITSIPGPVKRGRKKQVVVTNAIDAPDAPDVPDVAAVTVPAPKRGRKTKVLYNDFVDAGVDTVCGNTTEDEHIILKLNIPASDTLSNDTPPHAYNNVTNNFLNVEEEAMETSETLKTTTIVDLLKDFEEKNKNNEWPQTTSIHCYWCCHKFSNSPYGLPIKYTDNKFHVIGCFCSLECTKAYNCDSKDSSDEIWERNNLISLMGRRLGLDQPIKVSPPRLALSMFGGHLSIDAFKQFSQTCKIININFPPMQTLRQQIEEINESELNEHKYIPVDADRIKTYKDKLNLKRSKPINTFEHTLDHSMNLKFNAP